MRQAHQAHQVNKIVQTRLKQSTDASSKTLHIIDAIYLQLHELCSDDNSRWPLLEPGQKFYTFTILCCHINCHF